VKAFAPIVSMVLPKSRADSDEQPRKADSPIEAKEANEGMDVIEEQPLNANSPIVLTFFRNEN
jgi:hypothetical protein